MNNSIIFNKMLPSQKLKIFSAVPQEANGYPAQKNQEFSFRDNFSLIAAVDQNFGLGKNNTLPWHLPSELRHFSEITSHVTKADHTNVVIMGRKTWESLPEKSKPLKNRINVVLTRENTFDVPQGVLKASSLDEALQMLKTTSKIEKLFVIGGGKVFEQAIQNPACKKIYLTQIEENFDCDTFFPRIDADRFALYEKSAPKEEHGLKYRYVVYEAVH